LTLGTQLDSVELLARKGTDRGELEPEVVLMKRSDRELPITRRHLIGTGGAALACASLPSFPAAFAQTSATLRAAITGYGVVNTLDPGKASLIS
jgi:hypothetical protein